LAIFFKDALFAINIAEDSITVSIILRLFCIMVVPVSVISKIASTSSGGLASVAPKERNICTFLFVPTRNHGVMIRGSESPKYLLYALLDFRCEEVVVRYSVEIRKVFLFSANSVIKSDKLLTGKLSGTAITWLTCPYSKSSKGDTYALASLTQSLPVIPTS
jgi:hypothetical protein